MFIGMSHFCCTDLGGEYIPFVYQGVSSGNLILDQLIIPKLIFSLLISLVLILYLGEILSWSLMGVKGLSSLQLYLRSTELVN